MASTQTITQGTGPFTSAGSYKLPASGRGAYGLDVRRQMFWTLTSVTFAANGLIDFDPRAQGFDYTPTLVAGWYQPAGSGDHLYIVATYDPVNHELQCWDLTDNDAGGTDTPAGQFLIMAVAE